MFAVRDIMSRNLMTFEVNVPLQIIISNMVQRNFGCAIILNQGRLVGIITERDLVRKIVYLNKRLDEVNVQQVMTSGNLITTNADQTILDAAKLMKLQRIKYLPVVTENEMFVGLVTQTDVVHNLEHLLVIF